ncbi:PD-(D/E)XK nuclease family protein [Acidithiobacillus sp. MC6.1]|nr:PD-(D/E)XK nuclease family protein [Acidithiobacillus sp. MC6.1]
MGQQNPLLGVMRASSWADFFDCSQRWYYTHVEKLAGRQSHQATIGSAVHEGAAYFDMARLAGQPVPINDACEKAMGYIAEHGEETDWSALPQENAESVVRLLTQNYCTLIAPKRNWVAVESRCAGVDIETDHGILRVTGTIDRVEDTDRGYRVSDLKSGKSAVKSGSMVANAKAHAAQLGIYTLMAEAELGIEMTAPAEIIGLNSTRDGRIGTVEIEDVKTPLLGTEDAPGLIDMAARMLSLGLFPPNPRSMMCGEKWCAGYSRCHFHS